MTISFYQEEPTAWLHCRVHCPWVGMVLFHAWKINALVPSYLSSSISQLKSEEYCYYVFFKYCTTRNAHLLILFIWRVPVSDQPLPLLPVLKLASLTILPEQLLSSPQSSHAGDSFSVKSS